VANEVDGDQVPVRHFGVVLTLGKWREIADKLRNSNVQFLIEPHIRFIGEAGEQATLFVLDPSGNALEFKAFANDAMVFAKT
jgi:extradiol dioxygenase family protein